MAADLEFFFDPVCPWAWVTSRWVKEVQRQRDYKVTWRFISLKFINEDRQEDWYTEEYRARHVAGLLVHRVVDQVRLDHGNDGVDRLYTRVGTAIHPGRRRPEVNADPVKFMGEMLAEAGLPAHLAIHALDSSHDAFVKAETDAAFARTGEGVGTPIITFHPGKRNEASFFGPVIASIPKGNDAVKLWDAIEVIATSSGMAELKRSNRAKLDFS